MKYFYYSPSQHAIIVRNSTIAKILKQCTISEVFDGKKFVEYSECSCNPSNFPDAIIVAKFAKGEKYQIKYNGILSNFTVE